LLLYSSKPSLGVFQLAGHFYFINKRQQAFWHHHHITAPSSGGYNGGVTMVA
jgi:hypothetical protein